MCEHLAHCLYANTFGQCPCGEGVPCGVHCQIQVYMGHLCDEFQILVTLLVGHKVDVEIVFFQNLNGFWKQDDGVCRSCLLTFVNKHISSPSIKMSLLLTLIKSE